MNIQNTCADLPQSVQTLDLDTEWTEQASPEQILEWANDTFDRDVALVSSFGPEGMVVLDMLCKVAAKPRVIIADTLRLPKETYALIDRIGEHYHIALEIVRPSETAVTEMTNRFGRDLFYDGVDMRKLCCNIRKVEPLNQALQGFSAWITGIRRNQTSHRSKAAAVAYESNRGMYKINPLVKWSNKQVWAYIKANDVPYNELHDRGYSSIGCTPCTRALKPGEGERAGRWWWEATGNLKECGLHLK